MIETASVTPTPPGAATPTRGKALDGLKQRKWAILLVSLAVAVAAGAVAYALPSTFRATATVLIEPDPAGPRDEQLATRLAMAASRDVALAAIKQLTLWKQSDFDPRVEKKDWTWRAQLAMGTDRPDTAWTDDKLAAAVLPAFNQALTIEPVPQTSLVRIRFEAASPLLAASAAMSVADSFVRQQAGTGAVPPAGAALQDQIAGLRSTLDSFGRTLQTYRDDRTAGTGGPTPAAEAAASSGAARLTQARLRRAESESVYKDIVRLKAAGRPDYTAIPAILRQPSVSEARKQEEPPTRKLAELSLRYGPNHPQVVQATEELQAARQRTAVQADAAAEALLRDHEAARTTERLLEAEQTQSRAISKEPGKGTFGQLEQALALNRQMVERFVARIDASATSTAAPARQPSARIVESAAPGEPVRPRRIQIVVIALLISLGLGVSMSLLLDLLAAGPAPRQPGDLNAPGRSKSG